MSSKKFAVTLEELEEVVATNNKKRFVLDGSRIRASQGHSIEGVDLKLEPTEPPLTLYHGTSTKNITGILNQGLLKGSRNHVHLSEDFDTARAVGARHGKPVVFIVQARRMCEDDHKFFLSDNGVWLTEHVPTIYLGELEYEGV